MVMEGDLTWDGERTVQYTDGGLYSCTRETHTILLTHVTSINSTIFFKVICSGYQSLCKKTALKINGLDNNNVLLLSLMIWWVSTSGKT